METIEHRKAELSREFKALKGKDHRLKFMIEAGKNLAPMPENLKMDHFLVKGCISQAWVVPQFLDNGRIQFHADSEALVVKGVIALLLKIYNGSEPKEIIDESGAFLKELGITEHLSMNRRNGLANVLKIIQYYAQSAITKA